MKSEDKNRYQSKTVAVVGYGVEGRSAFRYFSNRGATVTIVDESGSVDDAPEGVEIISGNDALSKLSKFDIVSRTPSLRPDRIKTNGRVTSVTREFFAECPAKIIGVTGTKGKGTTTTLVSEILKNAGKTVHLLGNIGSPALDFLDEISSEDVVCYELSSFQLWDLECSPEIAIVLVIANDHLDVHDGIQEYIDAKKNIARFQQPDDTIIFHPSNDRSREIAMTSPGHKLNYLSKSGAFIRGGEVIIDEQIICSVSDIGLLGKHNQENVTAAITAAWQVTKDVKSIAETVKKFTGLEHRIEYLRTIDEIDYYNDSYSSAAIAAKVAVEAFPGRTQVLILGGKNKGIDYAPVFDAMKGADIRQVVLFGENRLLLAEKLNALNYRSIVVEGDLSEVVEKARQAAMKGDIILFTPGTSSYDMFKNFKDRGEKYKKIIGGLA